MIISEALCGKTKGPNSGSGRKETLSVHGKITTKASINEKASQVLAVASLFPLENNTPKINKEAPLKMFCFRRRRRHSRTTERNEYYR